MPKCGSTTIQETLGINRAELRAAGYAYPESRQPRMEGPNTQLSQMWLDGQTDPEKFCGPLLDGSAGDLILSSEAIYQRIDKFSPSTLMQSRVRLRELGIQLHIYCVHRPEAAFKKSMYKQRVINQESSDGLFKDAIFKNADYRQVTDKLAAILDPEALHTFPLGPEFMTGFSAALGLDGVRLKKPEGDQNVSLPDVYVEILRQFNAMENAPGRSHVARLIIDASGCNSRALTRQARKAIRGKPCGRPVTDHDIDRLVHIENPPLNYSEAEFNEARSTLREQRGLLGARNDLAATLSVEPQSVASAVSTTAANRDTRSSTSG